MTAAFAAVSIAVALSALALPVRAQDREIVKVNGTAIRQSEIFERLWKRFGNDTLEEMVDELLLRQAAAKSGIKIGEPEVEKRYSKVRSQFSDPKLFEAELASAGSSSEKLKADLREQLQREKLVSGEKKLAVTDAELKTTFEKHKKDLGRPEGVHLRHILVEKQSEAEAIVSSVKGGADFASLAREKSLAPTGKLNGGDYGFVSKGMLPADIDEIAFAMKPSELRIIPSPKGYHILQALARRPAEPAEFAKVKEDLREMMVQEKIKTALPAYLRELRSKAEIKPAG